jgi:hypothetical protein
MRHNLGFARRNAEKSRKFFGSRHEAISKKCYLCVISSFRREVDENCALLYYSSHMLPICWQQIIYNNRTRTCIAYDYALDFRTGLLICYNGQIPDWPRHCACVRVNIVSAGPCVFVFVSWLRFCIHYCIWVPATSLHFILL